MKFSPFSQKDAERGRTHFRLGAHYLKVEYLQIEAEWFRHVLTSKYGDNIHTVSDDNDVATYPLLATKKPRDVRAIWANKATRTFVGPIHVKERGNGSV